MAADFWRKMWQCGKWFENPSRVFDDLHLTCDGLMHTNYTTNYRGADKSLARRGRKQATATKL